MANQENNQSISAPNDGCPDWAVDMIARILVLEVEAGTIKNPAENGGVNGWSTAKLDELMKIAARMDQQVGDSSPKDLSDDVEAIFVRIARGLSRDGHAPQAIAAMINARVPTGCRLPYCSADEVTDALD